MLHKGEAEGFASKNLEGYAGHLEMGQGEELVGILCHVDVVPEGDGWTTPHIVRIFAMERFLHVVQLTINTNDGSILCNENCERIRLTSFKTCSYDYRNR